MDKKDTICWMCANAVPNNKGRGCNWSCYGKPVEGWTAVNTVVAGMRLPDNTFEQLPTYRVDKCPQFDSDKDQYAKPIKGKLPKGVDPCSMRALHCNGQKVALN